MTKTPLIDRMIKRKAPKAWINELRQLQRQLKRTIEITNYYLEIIDTLAKQVEAQEQERK